MLLCYLIAMISRYTSNYTEHVLVFMGPAIISVIQSFFLWRFVPDAIVEMVAKKEEEKARSGLLKLYTPQNAELRYM